MAVNPYTLNSLYEKGILDYVPIELCAPLPYGTIDNTENPYLLSAQQGDLYKQAHSGDSFNSSDNVKSGRRSRYSVPSRKKSYTENSDNKLNNNFIKNETDYNKNFNPNDNNDTLSDVKNRVSGFKSKIANLPTTQKGLISAGLILLTLIFCFRSGKKPAVGGAAPGFWTKFLKMLKIK